MKKVIALISSLVLAGTLGIAPVYAQDSADAAADRIPGDVNNDGSVSAMDMMELSRLLLGKASPDKVLYGDVNNDGSVNVIDLIYVKSFLVTGEIPQSFENKVPFTSAAYGCAEQWLHDDARDKYMISSVLIDSYQELLDYIDSTSKVSLDTSKLKDTYNEEFFETQSVAVCISENEIHENQIESVSAEDNTLKIKVFDLNILYPMPWTNYFTVAFNKSDLQKYQIDKTEFYTDQVDVPKEDFSAESYDYTSSLGYDEWIDSADELDKFIDNNDFDNHIVNNLKHDYEQLRPDFFTDYKLLVFTGSVDPTVSATYDDTNLAIFIGTDSAHDHISFIKVPRSIVGDRNTFIRYNYRDVAMKPAVYLYPEKETDVSVSVDLNGTFSCIYPEFTDSDTSTWNVKAEPDGTLYTPDGSEYSYLFWEGTENTQWDMSKGYVVKGSDSLAFLRKQLPKMGLTPKEYNDFIVYWLPQLQKNEYNYITFQTDNYTDNAVLNVTPEPDSVLRVFMAYLPVSEKEAKSLEQTVEEPQFDTFTRDGFSVVEWGGTEIQR